MNKDIIIMEYGSNNSIEITDTGIYNILTGLTCYSDKPILEFTLNDTNNGIYNDIRNNVNDLINMAKGDIKYHIVDNKGIAYSFSLSRINILGKIHYELYIYEYPIISWRGIKIASQEDAAKYDSLKKLIQHLYITNIYIRNSDVIREAPKPDTENSIVLTYKMYRAGEAETDVFFITEMGFHIGMHADYTYGTSFINLKPKCRAFERLHNLITKITTEPETRTITCMVRDKKDIRYKFFMENLNNGTYLLSLWIVSTNNRNLTEIFRSTIVNIDFINDGK